MKTSMTTEQIKDTLNRDGFTLIEGEYKNSRSEFLVEHDDCRMIYKRTGTSIKNRYGCAFACCSTKGAICFPFIRDKVKAYGVTGVTLKNKANIDEQRYRVSSTEDIFEFSKENQSITCTFAFLQRRMKKINQGEMKVQNLLRKSTDDKKKASKTHYAKHQIWPTKGCSTAEDFAKIIIPLNVSGWMGIPNKIKKEIIKLNLKEAIYMYFGWRLPRSLKSKTDDELCELAIETLTKHNIDSPSMLEKIDPCLFRNIHKRGNLKDRIYTFFDREIQVNYTNMTADDYVNIIEKNQLTSRSETHAYSSKLYSAILDSCGFDYIQQKVGWSSDLVRLDKSTYKSKCELITANVLFLNGINYIASPKLNFLGPKQTNNAIADFVINDHIYVEVWGTRYDVKKSLFSDYRHVRAYKEKMYVQNQLTLCSIEGILLHRKIKIKNNHNKGLIGYLNHIQEQLSAFNINIEINKNMVTKIKASLSDKRA